MYIDMVNDKNVRHKDFKVNWDELKNTLLITTNGNLKIANLYKIEDKCQLFKN